MAFIPDIERRKLLEKLRRDIEEQREQRKNKELIDKGEMTQEQLNEAENFKHFIETKDNLG